MLHRYFDIRVRVEVSHTDLLFKPGRSHTCAVMVRHRMAAMSLLVTANKVTQKKYVK